MGFLGKDRAMNTMIRDTREFLEEYSFEKLKQAIAEIRRVYQSRLELAIQEREARITQIAKDLIGEMDTYMGKVPEEPVPKEKNPVLEKVDAKLDEIGQSHAVQQIVANADKIVRILIK